MKIKINNTIYNTDYAIKILIKDDYILMTMITNKTFLITTQTYLDNNPSSALTEIIYLIVSFDEFQEIYNQLNINKG